MRIRRSTAALVASLLLASVSPLAAQSPLNIKSADSVLTIAKGASKLLSGAGKIARFTVGDPAVAEVVVLSPSELLVNGKAIGTTSLFVWDADGRVLNYGVEVSADAAQLQRYLNALLPGQGIIVSASGNAVTLSGQVSDASQAQQAIAIAKGVGVTVLDNIVTPAPLQVQLQVRFAEISRNALEQYSSAFSTVDPQDLSDNGIWRGSTDAAASAVTFGLISGGARLDAIISALRGRGQFRSLAEPNLMALPGREASFLAGGEFPYPVPQAGGGNGNLVTVVFKEFGVKLKFTPVIGRNGSIRLKLAPEVSQLDFANALELQGFRIPSLLVRKAETEVEMEEGQHLAIAGLVDNQLLENVNKIPLLGDIPILGKLFQSKDARQRRTELIVLISPRIVRPSNEPLSVSTGEPVEWLKDKRIKQMIQAFDSTAATVTPDAPR